MRIGPFTNLISETFGVPKKTTTVVARALREADLLTSGARGVNAPDMSATDAARLSLALLTGEPPSTVVEELQFIRTLQCTDAVPEDTVTETDQLRERHTIEELMIALIEALGSPGWKKRHCEPVWDDFICPNISISIDASCREAEVRFPRFSGEYVDIGGQQRLDELYATRPMNYDNWQEIEAIQARARPEGRGMRVVRTISGAELFSLAVAITDKGVGQAPDAEKSNRPASAEEQANP